MTTTRPFQPYAHLHENTSGPGDQRPTAKQIIDDEGLVGRWSDKTILITGGSSGIGLTTAQVLHSTGARIFITARTKEKGEDATRKITEVSSSDRAVEVVVMELDSLNSVKDAARDFIVRSDGKLNVLINNAGIMAAPYEKTRDQFESHFGTNHLAPFLFTKLLLPALSASSTPEFASRVVNVSSSGHIWHNKGGWTTEALADPNFEKTEYNPWLAYGRSKTANVLHANAIERMYGSGLGPVHAFSLHPGGIASPLWKHQGDAINERIRKFPALWKNSEQGAATTVWCATAATLEGQKGFYADNCGETLPLPDDAPMGTPGYAKWTYDETAEKQLWEISEGLVKRWA